MAYFWKEKKIIYNMKLFLNIGRVSTTVCKNKYINMFYLLLFCVVDCTNKIKSCGFKTHLTVASTKQKIYIYTLPNK